MFEGNHTRFAAMPRTAFGRAVEHLPATHASAKTKAKARYQQAAKTAAALLPELPEPGESIHALMLGTFDLCQVIVPTVQRLPSCRYLRIATLCFSKRNAAELIGLLEARPGFNLTLLVSAFFKGHNKELFNSFCDSPRRTAGVTPASSANSRNWVTVQSAGPPSSTS